MSSPSHLATPNVPLSRAWNTWTADRYLEMSFLPLGLRLTPLVYAASLGRVSRFGPGDAVLLGRLGRPAGLSAALILGRCCR